RDRGRRDGAEGEAGDDAAVAASAAAQRPEQVGVVGAVDRVQRAVRGDYRGRPEVVAGQAVRAGEDPDAAAERAAGDADRRARAGGQGAAVGGQRRVQVDELDPRADDGRAVAL